VRSTSRLQLHGTAETWSGNGRERQAVGLPGLDAWVVAEPCGAERGGDVYSIAASTESARSRFVLADISGHGAQAAQCGARFARALGQIPGIAQPAHFARDANSALRRIAPNGEFATALVLSYSAQTSSLRLCNAGHPRPLWYRADRRSWELLGRPAPRPGRPVNLPFGVSRWTRYWPFSVRMGPNDLLLLYTDAINEARQRDGTMLGERGLLELVRGMQIPSLERFCDDLLGRIDAWRNAPAPDDQTLILVRRRESMIARSA
jgi:sigma-B regulation protein RsbU (phosphoserine phosphatase)